MKESGLSRVLPVIVLVGVVAYLLVRSFPQGPQQVPASGSLKEVWPVEATEGLQAQLPVQADGVDWWKETPVFQSGATVELSAVWTGPQDANVYQVLLMVPREATSPRFDSYNARTDQGLTTHGKPQPYQVPLAPGDHVVRFYLRTIRMDVSKEAQTAIHLVAQRPLIVAPASSNPADPAQHAP